MVRREVYFIRKRPKLESLNDHQGSEAPHHPLLKTQVIIGLLSNAGWTSRQAWENVLQYCCLRHKKSTVYRYFNLLRGERSYMIEDEGADLSVDEKIILAKHTAKGAMETYLAKGVPELGPMPDLDELGYFDRQQLYNSNCFD
jgi:hypothetical protein